MSKVEITLFSFCEVHEEEEDGYSLLTTLLAGLTHLFVRHASALSCISTAPFVHLHLPSLVLPMYFVLKILKVYQSIQTQQREYVAFQSGFE